MRESLLKAEIMKAWDRGNGDLTEVMRLLLELKKIKDAEETTRYFRPEW